jgi:hypothetical protein
MNTKVITTTAGVTVAAMLSSCTTQQLGQASRTAGLLSLGTGVGALVSGSNSARNVALALAAVAITLAIAQHYQASQEQKRYAQARAAAAARSQAYANAKARNNIRYVAVPVKAKSAKEKKGLMVYDAQKGTMASDQVFVPRADSIKANSIVEVDGKKALLESGFSGA